MKFTKSDILFVIYVLLMIVNAVSNVFSSDYSEKFESILQKFAILVDEETNNE